MNPSQMWRDEQLVWDPAQFSGVKEILLPREVLWMPDLFVNEL